MDESYNDWINAMNRIEYLESLLRVISETELSVDSDMSGDPVLGRVLTPDSVKAIILSLGR